MKHPAKLDYRYKCRLYAHVHGIHGREGGWIHYDNSGDIICQGWLNFYHMYGRAIERFCLKRYNKKTVPAKNLDNFSVNLMRGNEDDEGID